MRLPRFLQRALFPAEAEKMDPVQKPDDKELDNKLEQAAKDHRVASLGVRKAAFRQVTNSDHIRETLRGVLDAIEQRKGEKDG